MTGWELIAALRRLPSDVLEQPVIFDTMELNRLTDEYEDESIIVDNVKPFSSALDMNGNFIKLS